MNKKILKIINDFYDGKVENHEKDLGWYLYNELDVDVDMAYVIDELATKLYKKNAKTYGELIEMRAEIDKELLARKEHDKYTFAFELTPTCTTQQKHIARGCLGLVLPDDYGKRLYYNPVKSHYKIENDEQKEKRLG